MGSCVSGQVTRKKSVEKSPVEKSPLEKKFIRIKYGSRPKVTWVKLSLNVIKLGGQVGSHQCQVASLICSPILTVYLLLSLLNDHWPWPSRSTFELDPCDPWTQRLPVRWWNETWNNVFGLVKWTFDLWPLTFRADLKVIHVHALTKFGHHNIMSSRSPDMNFDCVTYRQAYRKCHHMHTHRWAQKAYLDLHEYWNVYLDFHDILEYVPWLSWTLKFISLCTCMTSNFFCSYQVYFWRSIPLLSPLEQGYTSQSFLRPLVPGLPASGYFRGLR